MTDQKTPKAGYRNPPKHTQFKKGKSGNPRGRPRKCENLITILQRVLNRSVRVKDPDRNMPIRDALIWALRDLTLQGDKQALALQRRILTEAGYDKPEPGPDADREKLFREIGERLAFIGDQKEDTDEG